MLSEQGNFAVVIGRAGDHWSETQFQRMLEEGHLHESKHNLCHFGEKLNKDGGDPSMVCFQALSTQPLPWHSCCGQPYDKHDKKDWDYKPA